MPDGPDGPRWAFEIKHDGFRFIARRERDRVRVFSRNDKDWTDKVSAIVEAMLALPVASATFDGKGVVIDDRGVTDFEAATLGTNLAGRGGSRAAFLLGSTCSRSTGTIYGVRNGKSAAPP